MRWWWWHMLLHDGSNLQCSQAPIQHNEDRMCSQRTNRVPTFQNVPKRRQLRLKTTQWAFSAGHIQKAWFGKRPRTFSQVQLMIYINPYMLNKPVHVGIVFDYKCLWSFFVHFCFASSWQLVYLLSRLPGEGGLQAQRQSQQASGHRCPRQPSFHSRCNTIMEQTHSTLACSLFPALDITAPKKDGLLKIEEAYLSLCCVNFE